MSEIYRSTQKFSTVHDLSNEVKMENPAGFESESSSILSWVRNHGEGECEWADDEASWQTWLGNIGTGAATGAATGAVAGPWGALVGGLAGAGLGALQTATAPQPQAAQPQAPRPPSPAPRPQTPPLQPAQQAAPPIVATRPVTQVAQPRPSAPPQVQ